MASNTSTEPHSALPTSTNNLILTEAETATLTRLSSRTLQRLAEGGHGPGRIQLTNRRVGYWRHDVLAWLDARTGPTSKLV